MGRVALAILTGLLWAGSLPATWPVTASIFGLALFVFFSTLRQNKFVTRTFRRD